MAYAPGTSSMLVGDPRRLRQVLFNLADNAVKFTGEGDVVLEVRICRDCLTDRESVLFAIRDTGSGIHEDRLEQLFQPFTPLDNGARQPTTKTVPRSAFWPPALAQTSP